MIISLKFRLYLISINLILLLIFIHWIFCLTVSSPYDFHNAPSIIAYVLFTKNITTLILSNEQLILPYLWDIGVFSTHSILNYILKDRESFVSNFLGSLFFLSMISSNPFRGLNFKFTENAEKPKEQVACKKEKIKKKKSRKSVKSEEGLPMSVKFKNVETFSKCTQTSTSLKTKCCQFPNFESSHFLKGNIPLQFIENNIEKFITEHSIQTGGLEAGDFEEKPEKQTLLNSIKAQAHKNLGIPLKLPTKKKDVDVVKIEDLMQQSSSSDVKSNVTSVRKNSGDHKKSLDGGKANALETIFVKKNGFVSNSEISSRKSEKFKYCKRKIVDTDSGYQF